MIRPPSRPALNGVTLIQFAMTLTKKKGSTIFLANESHTEVPRVRHRVSSGQAALGLDLKENRWLDHLEFPTLRADQSQILTWMEKKKRPWWTW